MNKQLLEEKKIAFVFNVCGAQQEGPSRETYRSRFPGIQYLQADGFADFECHHLLSLLPQLMQVLSAAQEQSHGAVLLHCQAGQNRSALLAAAAMLRSGEFGGVLEVVTRSVSFRSLGARRSTLVYYWSHFSSAQTFVCPSVTVEEGWKWNDFLAPSAG